jgi:hypothetical protein
LKLGEVSNEITSLRKYRKDQQQDCLERLLSPLAESTTNQQGFSGNSVIVQDSPAVDLCGIFAMIPGLMPVNQISNHKNMVTLITLTLKLGEVSNEITFAVFSQ